MHLQKEFIVAVCMINYISLLQKKCGQNEKNSD